MKDRHNTSNGAPAVAAIVFLFIIACLYFSSCTPTAQVQYNEYGEEVVPTSAYFKKPREVAVFTDNGHTYRAYKMNGGEASWGGIVHDPDCPKCAKKQ